MAMRTLDRVMRVLAIGGAVAIAACNALAGLDRDYVLGASDASVPDGSTTAPPPPPSAQVDAAADADAASECPGTKGPKMVRVDGYCIDATEVTEAQYLEFFSRVSPAAALDASPPLMPQECAFKDSFLPGGKNFCYWNPDVYPNFPVVCVDWCDAYAYCKWAGKRLCGAIGGGPIAWAGGDDINPDRDQWYRACSRAGTRAYPYGSPHAPGACHDEFVDAGVNEAGAYPQCQGGYEGIFDMTGNASEWEDSCDDSGGGDAGTHRCKQRGRSYFSNAGEDATCRVTELGAPRRAHFEDIGFRCCAP